MVTGSQGSQGENSDSNSHFLSCTISWPVVPFTPFLVYGFPQPKKGYTNHNMVTGLPRYRRLRNWNRVWGGDCSTIIKGP